MIVHNQVCNYCGDQIELPLECEEDSYFKSKDPVKSKLYGISVDIAINPIKSFEGYRRRSSSKHNLTFCSKECLIEYVSKSVTDEGTLESP